MESFKTNYYWIYFTGFLLIALQIINIFPPWFTPTDWGKVIVFRIIMAVLIFLFLFQVLYRKDNISAIKEKIRPVSKIFIIFALLSGTYLLSTVFSLDSHFSLWGNPERNGGLVNFVFYIFFSILLFLIVKKNDWKKILDLTISIGIFVCLIAIIQQLGLFSNYLISFQFRPVSTFGNTIMLSLYLLLLAFPTLSFGLKEKNKYKKLFYLFSCVLFISIIIFSTETRGTIVGLFIGLLWFLFAYSGLNKRIKIYAFIFILITILILFSTKIYLDSHLDIYKRLPPIISNTLDRTLSIFEGSGVMKSRISAWKVSLNALKERPVFGYGPENFMIAFDKYYDPSLPQIGPDKAGIAEAEWWDRAHSLVFDLSVATGIPSLIIYISLLVILVWQLQRIKKTSPENAIIFHGLQAAFIGYFISLLFSFDSVSTYLTFFLLVGYSMYLISEYSEKKANSVLVKFEQTKLYPYRIFISSVIFICLIFFIFVYNIKPLILNKEINMAEFYLQEKDYSKTIETINKVSLQIKGSIIDDYLSRKSITLIYGCIKDNPDKNLGLVTQAIDILKKTSNSHPTYLQNWLLLGEFDNILIEQKNKLTNASYSPTEEMEKLKAEANYYFEKAYKLSPKRQIVLKEWAKTKIVTNEYIEAEEKANECLNLNPDYLSCLWEIALIKGYSKDSKGFIHYFDLSKDKGYDTESEESLKQLVDMFIRNNDYPSLVVPYQKLVEITTDKQQKAQMHAALAATYLELKQFSNAKKEAQKIFKLIQYFPLADQAQVKIETEKFIQNLGQ